MSSKSNNIDQNLFIKGPYKKCPKCEKNAYGVELFSISKNFYMRKCGKCSFKEKIGLPNIEKKIIYLDQFVISNMMKSINTEHRNNKNASDWRKVFEILDKLNKLQLIVCPESQSHFLETLLSEDHPSIKRILVQLSCNISFKNYHDIQIRQLHRNLNSWLKSEQYNSVPDKKEAFTKDPNIWNDNIIITVKSEPDIKFVESMRNSRDERGKVLSEYFIKWKNGEKLSFKEILEDEIKGYGIGLIEREKEYKKKIIENIFYKKNVDFFTLLTPEPINILNQLRDILVFNNIRQNEVEQKLDEFLHNPSLLHCPFIDISTHLWASIRRKAIAGQKKPPNRGTFIDIDTISNLMPYCDAMLIDNEFRAYLFEEPLKSKFRNYSKIYSQNTIEEFLKYLEEIKDSIDGSYIEILKDLYGKKFDEPYIDIFKIEK